MTDLPSHLASLEAEAIHIIREGVAEARNPVLLFSGGKDSTVLAHLLLRAFFPAPPPVPLLHIDSTWEFSDVLAFRDAFADRHEDSAMHRKVGGCRLHQIGDQCHMAIWRSACERHA